MRAHARSQNVLYSCPPLDSPCAGHAHVAPGRLSTMVSRTCAGSRASLREMLPALLERRLLELVDVRVDVLVVVIEVVRSTV